MSILWVWGRYDVRAWRGEQATRPQRKERGDCGSRGGMSVRLGGGATDSGEDVR